MKKVLVTILTLALFTMGLASVSAAESKADAEAKPDSKVEGSGSPFNGKSESTVWIDVTGDPVYRIDINWPSLLFEYQFGTWNPDTHSQSGTVGWQNDTRTVKMTNHSNSTIDYDVKFGKGGTTQTVNSCTATITGDTGTIETAVGTEFAGAPAKSFDVKVSNRPTTNMGASFKLDTVVITLTPGAQQ